MYKDGEIGTWINKSIDRQTHTKIDRKLIGMQKDRWKNKLVDKKFDREIDRYADRWMDRKKGR